MLKGFWCCICGPLHTTTLGDDLKDTGGDRCGDASLSSQHWEVEAGESGDYNHPVLPNDLNTIWNSGDPVWENNVQRRGCV